MPTPATELVATTHQSPEDDGVIDYGYFASTDMEQVEIDESAEPWYKYDQEESHIFYPIYIGEVLNQRYRVDHKLGHGGFSTVWMAYDLQNGIDVALKVMAAGGSGRTGESGEYEYSIQKEIIQSVQDTSHLLTYLATFSLRGDKGSSHRVLVFPLLGQCLDLNVNNKSMATRMSAARQLLEALENLHKADILHRDLNNKNCIWGMATLNHLSRDAKYKLLGRPLKEDLPDELWKKGEMVKPLMVPDNLCTDTFYLGDFGLAMKLGASDIPPGRPPSKYCSPDRLHNQDPSFACDMWGYMCIFAELYFNIVPFTTFGSSGIIPSIIDISGPLPEKWKGHYIYSEGALDSWYEHTQDDKSNPEKNLKRKIAFLCPETDAVERQHIFSIMHRGFSACPEKRLTATQLLQDRSFKAIVEKYCSY